ncbi:protein RRNAD1-like [Amphibalanus amphitrite]|uniref:protein RRNAD1-like n=1 Tax=Amphibalanus amphitrite TaxID=1232801 RepID=UPI001C92703C|nr:protein RRNAD1-like [Amphibalanus amphitrite]
MEPENIEEYVEEIQHLLSHYSWLFDFKMTQMLSGNVFDLMPVHWFEFGKDAAVEVLHDVAEGTPKDNWPPGLASFVGRCGRLRPLQLRCDEPTNESPLPEALTRGVSAKKRHELRRMVPAVAGLCTRTGLHLVMDVGAGLGHLAESLRQSTQLRILGVERDASLLEAAGRRRRRLTESGAAGCPACLRIVRCEVADSDSGQQRLQRLAAEFAADRCACRDATQQPTGGWCLTGLHCCGDLAPQLLRLLVRLPEARALLLLSCCYHKAADGRLLSRRLATVRLGHFGRRLACQQSVSAWCHQSAADHARHATAVGWRALLEVVAQRTGLTVSDRRRHGTHRYANFAEYAAAMLGAADDNADCDQRLLQCTANDVFKQYGAQLQCVEFLTALQACLQPVLEGLLLLDRMLFLREHAISAELMPLFEDQLSPRTWALMAWKT